MSEGPLRTDQITDLVAALRRDLGRLDPDGIPDDEVATAIASLARGKKLFDGALTLVARRAADTQDRKTADHRSPEDMLANLTGISRSTAKKQINASKQLDDQPDVAAAVKAGELSTEQASAVSDAVAADPEAASDLLDTAQNGSLQDLRNACRDRTSRADANPDQTRRRHYLRRSFRSWLENDGEWRAAISAPSDIGARIEAALRGEHDQIFKDAHAAGRREHDGAYRLDALTAVAERGARCGGHVASAPVGGRDGQADPGGGGRAQGASAQKLPAQPMPAQSASAQTASAQSSTAQAAQSASARAAQSASAQASTDHSASAQSASHQSAFAQAAQAASSQASTAQSATDEPATDPTSAAQAASAQAAFAQTSSARATPAQGSTAQTSSARAAPAQGSSAQTEIIDSMSSESTPNQPPIKLGSHAETTESMASESTPDQPPIKLGSNGVAAKDCAPRRRSGRQTKVIVNVDAAALKRGWLKGDETCDIAGIGRVSLAAVKQLIPEAHIAYVIRDAQDVSVAHLGRQVTARQRTALEARGYQCEVPGCSTSHLLEIDHVTGWTITKLTSLDDLAWLCMFHHAQKTDRGYCLLGSPGHRTWTTQGGIVVATDASAA